MISPAIDMRSEFGPARDQGRRPTCMAFAASDAHAFVHGRPVCELSAEYAHYSACTRMPSFLPLQGTSGSIMLDALAHDGQPSEPEWPYLVTLPSDLSQYKPPVAVSGLVRHRGERLEKLEQAEALLLAGWPIIFGLRLSIAFLRLGANSVLRADSDIQIVGRHAMIAVGTFSDGNDQGYLMRNSWGQKWGDQGYGLVSRDYVMPRIIFLGVYRD